MTQKVIENRASFMARFLNESQENQWLIRKSYDEAKNGHGHAKQFRKDGITRYFVHPRIVAMYAADRVGITHPTIICSALKHDCGEDTSIDGNITEGYFEWQNYAEFINTRTYNRQVAWIIIFMTKPVVDNVNFNSKDEVYDFYINRFKTVITYDDEIESARKILS